MSNLRNVYQTEDGINELVNMCIEGKVFDSVVTQGDVILHNYVIGKLNKVGFTKENIKAIVEYAMRLTVKQEKSERQKVDEEYFGDSAYKELD